MNSNLQNPQHRKFGFIRIFFVCACFVISSQLQAQTKLQIHAGSNAKETKVHLSSPEARTQLVVTALEPNTRFPERDVTHQTGFTVGPNPVVSVTQQGWVVPLANGSATITAQIAGADPVSIPVVVEKFDQPRPISFPNDIVPIFTKNECNMGACHAKSAGQNGFHLSLFGYDPELDYENLALNSRGRRVTLSAPEYSLLLMKATGEIPHGGGVRSGQVIGRIRPPGRLGQKQECLTDRRMIPQFSESKFFPGKELLRPGHSSNFVSPPFSATEPTRDITRAAQFESNQPEMAEVDEHGLVSVGEKTVGSTSVLVRFQEHVDVFTATIPRSGAQLLTDLPKPRNFVDERIFAKLKVLGIPTSAEIDDTAFLRRVTVDVAGRIPSLEETNSFLQSADPDKRKKKIDQLLESVDYANYFAGKWAGLLRNKSQGGLDWVSRDTYSFHAWLRSSLNENKPFDQLAAELITASGKTGESPAASWYRAVADPKERMQDIAQVFLGVRMQCAQCHHHPYEKWSQNDYYHFAAFFSTIERKEVYRLPEDDIIFHNRKPAEMKNPASGEMLKPAVLGGEPLEIAAEDDPRRELANWIRQPENPYFSRMVVNRYWKHFFGRALVEPEDDIRPTNPASHPALMDGLAKQFVESGFDLKQLIRTLCNSRTYQLGADPLPENEDDAQNFARFYPRRLSAEVLLDAINDVTGSSNSFNKQPVGIRAVALPDDNANKESEFLTMFGRPQMDSACECERTGEANLGQSLHLINSDVMQSKLADGKGLAKKLAASAKDRDDNDRLNEIYLRAFSREPSAEELSQAKAHLLKKRDLSAADPKNYSIAKAEQEAFEDILWVITNTKEFLFLR